MTSENSFQDFVGRCRYRRAAAHLALKEAGRRIPFCNRWGASKHVTVHFADADDCWLYGSIPESAHSGSEPASRGSWPSILDVLANFSRLERAATAVVLVVPASRMFVLDVPIPRQSMSKAGGILRLEFERVAPLRWDDVLVDSYVGIPLAGDGASVCTAHLVVAKKSFVLPLLQDLRDRRLRPVSVLVRDYDGSLLPINLLMHSEARTPTLIGQFNRAIIVGAAVAMLSAGAALGAEIWRQLSELDDLSTRSSSARTTLLVMRKSADAAGADAQRARAAQTKKLGTLPFFALWEELTRVMPDTAWLTDLRFADDTLEIDGFAQSASELISLLTASPCFFKAEFTMPVVKDAQNAAERFQIKMSVRKKS